MAAYLIFTDRQMAAVARARPATAEALGPVDGVGDARLRRWGAEVLAVIETVPAEPVAPPSENVPAAAQAPAGRAEPEAHDAT